MTRGILAHLAQKRHGGVQLGRVGAQQRLKHRRRIAGAGALFQQALGKAGHIVFAQGQIQRVIRKLCLHPHLAGQRATAGAAGHLREQGKQAFFCPKIRAIQPAIGIQRHHPRQAGEIMALGQHLRADQDIQLARAHLAVDLGPGVAPADGVAVDAGNARLRKLPAQGGFDALGALPQRFQVGVAAAGAGVRDGFVVTAVVTLQAVVVPVQHQPRRAMRAGR